MGNDPSLRYSIPEVPSDSNLHRRYSYNCDHDHHVLNTLAKGQRYHHLRIYSGALNRPVSTGLQLHGTSPILFTMMPSKSVEPKEYKDSINPSLGIMKTKARWFARGLSSRRGYLISKKSSFAPVARLEDTEFFWAFACSLEHGHLPNGCERLRSAYQKALKCGKKDLSVSKKGTVLGGLWYRNDSSLHTAFADADHAGCQDTRRSTSGSMQLLGDRLVSWSSKRQKSALRYPVRAEYCLVWLLCSSPSG
ncbi:hypothetical protein Tco_0405251 [Tanacetum coccineum]